MGCKCQPGELADGRVQEDGEDGGQDGQERAVWQGCGSQPLAFDASRHGYGSKFNHQGTAGFSPWFHLPGFPKWVPIFDPQPHIHLHGTTSISGDGLKGAQVWDGT